MYKLLPNLYISGVLFFKPLFLFELTFIQEEE